MNPRGHTTAVHLQRAPRLRLPAGGLCSEHKGDFEGFLGEEFAEYCATMERLGTWGDELTLVRGHKRSHFPLCSFLGACSP